MKDTKDYIKQAESDYEQEEGQTLSIEEFIDLVLENPEILNKKGSKYILDAVKYYGQREVFEEGEKKKRWIFFDDPCNNGENAILGNTETLNNFVNSLEAMSVGSGKEDKIIWIEGPTASGKSEFRRCMVNGLRGYSETEEGRIWTLEMNATGLGKNRYEKSEWYESPTQANPLSILPDKTKKDFLNDINKETGEKYKIPSLPPFSKEARKEILKEEPEELLKRKRVRVRNYKVNHGNGIGIISSEDKDIPTKNKLVGKWNEIALSSHGGGKDILNKGKLDKRLFIYNGLLSQGRSVLSIIEDSVHHIDMLLPLLNVLDEREVKIDSDSYMDIDSVIVMISNPDLSAKISQNEELGQKDPMKAVKRRMDKYYFDYLINTKLEAKMIIKELFGITLDEIKNEEYDYINSIQVEEMQKEIAPRTIQAASIYNVLSRMKETVREAEKPAQKLDALAKGQESMGQLQEDNKKEKKEGKEEENEEENNENKTELKDIEKAIIYDEGKLIRSYGEFSRPINNNKRFSQLRSRYSYDMPIEVEEKDSFKEYDKTDIETKLQDRSGIPVTYTRDLFSQILQTDFERDYDKIILPQDIISLIEEELSETPVFSEMEIEEYETISEDIHSYILGLQERDVILSIMNGSIPTEKYFKNYIDNILLWGENRDELTEEEKVMMKEFEKNNFAFENKHYNNKEEPKTKVKGFRENQILKRVRKATHDENRDYTDLPIIWKLIKEYGWGDVLRNYDELELEKWRSPTSGTETHKVKNECLETLQNKFNYSEDSAKFVSELVVYYILQNEKKDKSAKEVWEDFM